MNKSEIEEAERHLTSKFAVDKSDFTNGLLIGGGWNAYCLAKTSD